jgi:hypothetical protein
MRGPRYFVAVFWLMGVVAASGMAAEYSPKDLLKFRPTQTGVDYDTPADAAAIDACKVELVTDTQKRTVGYALRDGQGCSAGSSSPPVASTSTSGATIRTASKSTARSTSMVIAALMSAGGSTPAERASRLSRRGRSSAGSGSPPKRPPRCWCRRLSRAT